MSASPTSKKRVNIEIYVDEAVISCFICLVPRVVVFHLNFCFFVCSFQHSFAVRV